MFESIKMYSLLVMVSFPSEDECNKVNKELYGEDTKCFITYEDPRLEAPPNRPKILEGEVNATVR